MVVANDATKNSSGELILVTINGHSPKWAWGVINW